MSGNKSPQAKEPVPLLTAEMATELLHAYGTHKTDPLCREEESALRAIASGRARVVAAEPGESSPRTCLPRN